MKIVRAMLIHEALAKKTCSAGLHCLANDMLCVPVHFWSSLMRVLCTTFSVYIVLSTYNFGLSIGSSLLENCAIAEHANKLMIRVGRVEEFLHKLQCPIKYNNFLLQFCEVFSMIFVSIMFQNILLSFHSLLSKTFKDLSFQTHSSVRKIRKKKIMF